MKKYGFTLAEVLITLGIIGVIAALTIPSLITNYRARELRARFLKAYSVVQQAFKQMEAEDVSLDPASYPSSGKTLFYLTFKNYLQAPLDCGNYYTSSKNTPCYNFKDTSLGYYNLNNTTKVPWSVFDAGQLVLQDGTLLLFNSDTYGWWVSVDLNGFQKGPNRFGYDLFTFEFKDGELRTMGDLGTKYSNSDMYCSSTSKNQLNGIACAKIAKIDAEYFNVIIRSFK